MVNTSDQTQPVTLNLQGLKTATTAATITLHSDVMDAENTLDEPERIVPVQGTIAVTPGKKAATITDDLPAKTFKIYKVKK
jgi:alpha-L-arabinofuranosidase